jgi:hypothetical protein
MPTDPEQFDAIFRHIREHPKQPQSKRVEELLGLLSSLRDDLSKPEKVRVITRLFNVLSNFRWNVRVSPTAEGFRTIYFPADRGHLSSADEWEYGAVRDLLELVPYLGKWPRIRRCAECKGWLFAAKRRDKQFHDGICRQRHYDSSPEMRESKKLYMRKYRADEKKREESRKIGVGFKGRAARSRKSPLRLSGRPKKTP